MKLTVVRVLGVSFCRFQYYRLILNLNVTSEIKSISIQTRQRMAFVLPHHRVDRLRPGHLGRRLHRAVVRPSVWQRHDLPVGRLHDRIILLVAHRHSACQGFYCGNFVVDVGLLMMLFMLLLLLLLLWSIKMLLFLLLLLLLLLLYLNRILFLNK
jgi:hypothetical protein